MTPFTPLSRASWRAREELYRIYQAIRTTSPPDHAGIAASVTRPRVLAPRMRQARLVFYDARMVTGPTAACDRHAAVTPKRRTGRPILTLAFVTAVLGLCTGALAHATLEDGAAMDCGAHLCAGATGCSATTIASFPMIAVAPLPDVASTASPVAQSIGVRIAASRATPDRSAHALAPRSPPLR